MAKERWGQINVFDKRGTYIGRLVYFYPSRLNYTINWLNNSRKFYDWTHFVYWQDGKKIRTYYRYK